MNPILPTEYLILLAAALAAAVGYTSWRSSGKCTLRLRLAFLALRLLLVAGVTLLAFNPCRTLQRATGSRNEWAFLLDRSGSMAAADVDRGTRFDAARKAALAQQAGSTEVKLFTFGAGLEAEVAPADLAVLKPTADMTDILRTGHLLLDRYQGANVGLAGIVLFSDGRQVMPGDRQSLAARATARGIPIHVCPLGGPIAARDLAVALPRTHYVSYVGQKLKVRANVVNRGLGDIAPSVTLEDTGGHALQTQQVSLKDGETHELVFEVALTNQGYADPVVRTAPWEGDTSPDNDRAQLGVSVLKDKIRIFMAEGAPYWDSKFLLQLLRQQPNIHVTAVSRVSANRFFKVSSGEESLQQSSESAFPADAAELSAYDMVIFGKGMEYFVTPEQTALLKNFLRDQGGCVVFARGKPYSGEMPEMEAIEPMDWGEPAPGDLAWTPTTEGESAGLFGGLLPGASDPAWAKLPRIKSALQSRGARAFATVLVEGRTTDAAAHAYPLVTARRFGKGMTLAVNAEGLWQWEFFAADEARALYEEFWTQLIQWAATYSEFLPGHEFALSLSQNTCLPGESIGIQLAARTGYTNAISPMVRVFEGALLAQELIPYPSAAQERRWDASLTLDHAGTYRVEAADAGGTARKLNATLVVRPPPAETDELGADPSFLEQLAQATGGQVLTPADAESVLKTVSRPALQPEAGESVRVPRWDRGWLLCLLMAILAFEWYLRRRHGLL